MLQLTALTYLSKLKQLFIQIKEEPLTFLILNHFISLPLQSTVQAAKKFRIKIICLLIAIIFVE